MAESRQIIHVDMDAFFASVEVLDNPELRGKPVIVGGDPNARGVVAAASYEVRKFGVHSAMPMRQALKLCPQAIVIRGRMHRYIELSRKIRDIFERYTPLVEPVSVDEAFLDVTGCPLDSVTIGRNIKKEIKTETGLTASLGIAPNKFLAKVASDLKKPDGFVIITEANKQQILDPLPVSAIYGVGKVTARTLETHGIRTIAQLRKWPLEKLVPVVGNFAGDLLDLANGIDNRPVELGGRSKSISEEHTFATDIDDEKILLGVILEQVQQIARRLREENLKAHTITLKLRYGNFKTITRSKTLENPTCATETLWQAAKAVFEQWAAAEKGALRLVGFRAGNLEAKQTGQMLLFDDPKNDKQKRLDSALDAIENRYGKDAIKRKL
jgi:DNA polymerase-4